MDKKIIKILLIVIAVIGVGSIVFAIVSSLGPDTLVKTPGVPRNESLRVVTTVESSPGYQVVENKFDGYQITVPSNWFVADSASIRGGLKIYHEEGATEVPIEIDSGLLLTIFALEKPRDAEIYIPADVKLDEININGETVYVTRYKVEEEVGIDANINIINEVIENSQVTAYLFSGGGKTYLVTCTAIADNFTELAQLCEEQVQTFTITN